MKKKKENCKFVVINVSQTKKSVIFRTSKNPNLAYESKKNSVNRSTFLENRRYEEKNKLWEKGGKNKYDVRGNRQNSLVTTSLSRQEANAQIHVFLCTW